MKLTMMAGALALSLVGTGCATKKYVAQTVAPIESRVGSVETKNTEQDKAIADQRKDLDKQIEDVSTDLSRTKERLTDVDAKAIAAGQSAQQANTTATQANVAANGAQRAADGARSFAEQGLNRVEQTMTAMNKWNMTKSITVLFPVGQATLTKDAKQTLDEFAGNATDLERYQVEVQGFTDKTGPATYNETLSEARAEAVARYLANEHKIPLRSISMLGSGYALPVADDKTRDGRKQNRRVEVKILVSKGLTS